MQTLMPALPGDSARHASPIHQAQAVERAIQTMHTHLPELLTLEDLASVACLSPFHFNRVFRRQIGIPPREFLTALRFQRARQLLLLTSLTVTDICYEVGYTSTGSFTSRFTQLVGLSPSLLRKRAHAFEPLPGTLADYDYAITAGTPGRHSLLGRITAPVTFRGTIYVGLFTTPIPQGAPVRCTRIDSPGWYLMIGLPDGVYFLRAAAFPLAADSLTSLLPGKNLLLGNNPDPLVIRSGQVCGTTDLALHPPCLTDPPLVMGLPLLSTGERAGIPKRAR